MKRSSERILTTHTGSLIRTTDILKGMKALAHGQPYDQAKLEADIEAGIAEAVRKQVEAGLDVVNDGEYARRGFTAYINDRLGGLEPRAVDAAEAGTFGNPAERAAFPGFFEQLQKYHRVMWMPPEVGLAEAGGAPASNSDRFQLVAPLSYTGQALVQRDIARLKSALAGLPHAEAFMTAVTPVMWRGDANVLEFYASEEAYLYAQAEVLREEYKAITDAGLVLQLDYAALNPQTQILRGKGQIDADDHRRARRANIEVVNHALAGIPEERVRYHHCWGSMNSPHTQDMPLRDIVEDMLKLNVQAYGIEGANPRHEHEWMVWKDVKLPEGKILIPGLVSQSTNVVEHPELIAWRIKNYASVIGRENIIAGVDCGFSQDWDLIRLHPSVQWAKLRSLAEGAALASKELWGR